MTFQSLERHIANSHDGRGCPGPHTTVFVYQPTVNLKHRETLDADLFGFEEILCVCHEHLLYALI